MMAIGFDVYGTLVDPLAMEAHLRALIGAAAGPFAAQWRATQLTYSFRRALMRRYADFDTCTAQALLHTARTFGYDLTDDARASLLARYRELAAFPDAASGIAALRAQGHTLVAFSNGVETSVRATLDHADILALLDGVVSADDLQTFKPDPAVYHALVRRVGQPPDATWVVSGNPFDVIGAKGAGLRAAWVRRDPHAHLDPWEFTPDLIVPDLDALAARFADPVANEK